MMLVNGLNPFGAAAPLLTGTGVSSSIYRPTISFCSIIATPLALASGVRAPSLEAVPRSDRPQRD
jgi:hypothetical protein